MHMQSAPPIHVYQIPSLSVDKLYHEHPQRKVLSQKYPMTR